MTSAATPPSADSLLADVGSASHLSRERCLLRLRSALPMVGVREAVAAALMAAWAATDKDGASEVEGSWEKACGLLRAATEVVLATGAEGGEDAPFEQAVMDAAVEGIRHEEVRVRHVRSAWPSWAIAVGRVGGSWLRFLSDSCLVLRVSVLTPDTFLRACGYTGRTRGCLLSLRSVFLLHLRLRATHSGHSPSTEARKFGPPPPPWFSPMSRKTRRLTSRKGRGRRRDLPKSRSQVPPPRCLR